MNITVLYHDDADGFGAAYAVWKAFNGKHNLTFIPVNYSEPVPEIDSDTDKLYILDFSYDRATCENLKLKYDLTIIDHHKTAANELKGLLYAVFNMDSSGCMLTWKFLGVRYNMPAHPIPSILEYVQDHDLWKFNLRRSKEVNAYIHSLPRNFKVWDSFDLDTAMLHGESILRFQNMQVDKAVKRAWMVHIDKYQVPCVNTAENVSEVCNRLLDVYPMSPFASTYFCLEGGHRTIHSLRSRGDFDVSVVAKKFGGGGHPSSAGFTVTCEEIE